jgi:hypothetical protein
MFDGHTSSSASVRLTILKDLFSILNSGSTCPKPKQSAEVAGAIVTAFGING